MRVMKQQMISKFLQKDFESKLKVEDVPDADVEKYYKEHPAEFNQKDEVRVSEIVVKDKGKADKALRRGEGAAQGARRRRADQKGFRDLVTKYSEDEESKPRGGRPVVLRQGLAPRSRSRSSTPRSSSRGRRRRAAVKTDKGWAVLRLTQKRPGFNRPLAEVKRQIQQRLFRDLRTQGDGHLRRRPEEEEQASTSTRRTWPRSSSTPARAAGGLVPGMSLGPPGMAPAAGMRRRGSGCRRRARPPPVRSRKASRELARRVA